MPTLAPPGKLKVFATCPPSGAPRALEYLAHVVDVGRISEEFGCEGILVYTDNSLVDPWLVSQLLIENTVRLCPLVAVQPAYMHPYAVAKMVTTLGFLHRRRVYLNMVAGGFANDLAALSDRTPHDRRYQRLGEYTEIILSLLQGTAPVTYSGEFYQIEKLKLTPPLPPELLPGVFVSGSSEAGVAAARRLGATAVRYPRPSAEYEAAPSLEAAESGIRVGIIARDDPAEAWAVARARFPEDRKGQLTHQLAMKVSDSEWHRQLSSLATGGAETESPYWLHPFTTYKTFCPYLVGSYDSVARELALYVKAGYRTLIIDVPTSAEDLRHIGQVITRVTAQVAS